MFNGEISSPLFVIGPALPTPQPSTSIPSRTSSDKESSFPNSSSPLLDCVGVEARCLITPAEVTRAAASLVAPTSTARISFTNVPLHDFSRDYRDGNALSSNLEISVRSLPI